VAGALLREPAADRWFGKSWALALPEGAYARSIADGQPWFPNYRGMGKRFLSLWEAEVQARRATTAR